MKVYFLFKLGVQAERNGAGARDVLQYFALFGAIIVWWEVQLDRYASNATGSDCINLVTSALVPSMLKPCSEAEMPMIVSMQLASDAATRSVGEKLRLYPCYRQERR